jgi:hypothetical protein
LSLLVFSPLTAMCPIQHEYKGKGKQGQHADETSYRWTKKQVHRRVWADNGKEQ